MKLKEQQKLTLNDFVNLVSTIQGVVGIVLFGSQARGDYDEFSDYDLLVLFENKRAMWESWDGLFQVVGNLKMNLHAIPETLDELKEANPVFLDELRNSGKVLFAKMPFEVYFQPLNLKPFTLITYDMRNVNYPDKMKASYFLYSKEGKGVIAKAGGTKISDGCVIVPSASAEEIVKVLASFGVQTVKTEVFVNPEVYRSWPTQNRTHGSKVKIENIQNGEGSSFG